MTRSAGADERSTLDSNLLVYAVDLDAGWRHTAAVQIIQSAARRDCWLALQAISEFYAVVTRKGYASPTAAAETARDWLQAFPSAVPTVRTVHAALTHAVAGRASYWDALLIATAAEAGCTVILTEDMADGTKLGGVEIHNPFDPGGGLTAQARRLLGL
jgi:predicted nucleic acid-binding protein